MKNMRFWDFKKQNMILRNDNFEILNNKIFKIGWITKFESIFTGTLLFLVFRLHKMGSKGPKLLPPLIAGTIPCCYPIQPQKRRQRCVTRRHWRPIAELAVPVFSCHVLFAWETLTYAHSISVAKCDTFSHLFLLMRNFPRQLWPNHCHTN